MGKLVGIAVALFLFATASLAATNPHKHHSRTHHHPHHHRAHHASPGR